MQKLTICALCLLLAPVILAPMALADPYALREGDTQIVGQHQVELLFVSDSRHGEPEAVFTIDGVSTPALRADEETVLPDGLHIYVTDILVNSRSGMVSYYLWEPYKRIRERETVAPSRFIYARPGYYQWTSPSPIFLESRDIPVRYQPRTWSPQGPVFFERRDVPMWYRPYGFAPPRMRI
jgi:hypothetical protein